MATIEQVEKLREKANVTYDEAKTALEASGGDLLDALIYLERNGKVQPPPNDGYYNSKQQAEFVKESSEASREKNTENSGSFTGLLNRFFKWCGRIIAKGNENSFEVRRNGKYVIAVPVTVLALFIIFAFWFVVPLVAIGLFFGYRYVFKGPDLEKTDVNRVMGTAADAAESLKKEVFEGRKAQ